MPKSSSGRLPNIQTLASKWCSEAAQRGCAALASRVPDCENGFVPMVRV